jgi:hypothetical protein
MDDYAVESVYARRGSTGAEIAGIPHTAKEVP